MPAFSWPLVTFFRTSSWIKFDEKKIKGKFKGQDMCEFSKFEYRTGMTTKMIISYRYYITCFSIISTIMKISPENSISIDRWAAKLKVNYKDWTREAAWKSTAPSVSLYAIPTSRQGVNKTQYKENLDLLNSCIYVYTREFRWEKKRRWSSEH